MTDSILETVKEFCNASSTQVFDAQILLYINSELNDLDMTGIAKNLVVSSSEETWADLITDIEKFESVKMLICLRVKLLWDPPQSSAVMESMKNQADKLEWKLQALRDRYYVEEE